MTESYSLNSRSGKIDKLQSYKIKYVRMQIILNKLKAKKRQD